MFIRVFYYHLLFLLLPCQLQTNGLHDELTGLSPIRPNRILLLEINHMWHCHLQMHTLYCQMYALWTIPHGESSGKQRTGMTFKESSDGSISGVLGYPNLSMHNNVLQ